MANRKWPIPTDAEIILNMRFHVYAYAPRSYHAEAQIEFPVGKTDFVYASIFKTAKTERGALRGVIEQIETSKWFHHLRKRGVRFKVRGCGMDVLYRGYL